MLPALQAPLTQAIREKDPVGQIPGSCINLTCICIISVSFCLPVGQHMFPIHVYPAPQTPLLEQAPDDGNPVEHVPTTSAAAASQYGKSRNTAESV